jgi:long-chain acyl-CoA synthetase
LSATHANGAVVTHDAHAGSTQAWGAQAGASSNIAPNLNTVPKLLLRNAQRFRDLPSMREKDLGIWQTWTWAQALDEVRALAIGLSRLGLVRGDTVAIVGDNRPRLYWAQAAIQSLGGIPVPVYQDAVADEMAFVLQHAGVKMAIVENQEQVDKIMAIAARVGTIQHIIYDAPRGLKDYDQTSLHDFEKVQASGRADLKAHANLAEVWRAEVMRGRGDETAAMLYTSGTTGQPKGVVLTHEAMITAAHIGAEIDNLTERDCVIAYLPLAWAGDHLLCFVQSFVTGYAVCCPESPATVFEDRREIGPTYFFAPPRVFENMLTQMSVRMDDAGAFKRGLYSYFMGVAKRSGARLLNGQSVGVKDRVLYGLGNALVYGPLRNRMGFSKLRVAYTAGEAIGPEIFSYYRSLGINLKQLYGQTEAGVYVTAQPDGEIYPDTVGKPVPGVEVKIGDNGEVLYRSPAQFHSYYKNEAATLATKTPDGWVHTGDAGFFDGRGHLRIIDRAKDVGKLRDGALFAPKYIENKLKFYPDIKEAVAFGQDRDYATVMINIEQASAGNWAERQNITYASYQELAEHPKVVDLIRGHVDAVNKSLAAEPGMGGAQIRRFFILHKELEADDGELTRTQKVRRGFIAERYAPLITALYDGSQAAHIKTEVTFEDGRKGTIEGNVTIVDLQPHPVLAAVPSRQEAA